MRIAVCIKAVPADARERGFDPATHRLDRGDELVLNPADAHAVAVACALRETGGASDVVAVSIGPTAAQGAMRTALAMGADRGLIVSDPALAGSDMLATSRALAAALAGERPSVALFGQQAGDANGALLWGAVAARLRLPAISRATEIAIEGDELLVRRQTESGYELLGAPLPCVVALASGASEPPVPTFRELKRAGDKPKRVLGLAEAGLAAADVGEAGSRTRVHALAQVPRRQGGAMLELEPDEAAAAILELLVARGIV